MAVLLRRLCPAVAATAAAVLCIPTWGVAARRPTQPTSGGRAPGYGRGVLVVDGDCDWRASVATVLEAEGYSFLEAETGEQAIELVELDPLTLVVLAVDLPDMSGHQVCRVLRDRFGDDLQIIFVSNAGTGPLDRLAGLRIGADYYLEKPLTPEKLLYRINKLIRLSNLGASVSSADAGISVPTDARLPQLGVLTERNAAATALAEVYGEPLDVLEVAVLRHAPGLRCTMRYELLRGAAAQPERIYAKTYVSAHIAERVHQKFCAVADTNAVRVPVPIGYLPRLRLVLQSTVEGKPVTARLFAGDEALAARIADAAFALHASAAKFQPNHRLRHELKKLDALVTGLPPHLAARAREHVAAAAATLISLHWRRRPVHRDFHEGQILVDAAGGLGLLDLDNAAISEPGVDVAGFLARLQLVALKKSQWSAEVTAAASAFRKRYLSLDRRLDRRLVQVLEATALLRLACREFERGGRFTEELIDSSGALLEEAATRPKRSLRRGRRGPHRRRRARR